MSSVKTYHENLAVPLTKANRSHRIILLPNGLLTLLVSDPTEDLASAAVCIASGAHNDPDEIPGLAHFCEHLLFLGSKHFPNTSEFHDLLSKAGGRRNAFTTGEQTSLFFEVPSDALYEKEGTPMFNHLMQMFADSVKAPIFAESMYEKEVYAIDNEHNANVSKSGRVMYHGLRLISNENHPFHRFATGNFFTLNDMPKIKKSNVKDKLRKYYTENYIADKMTLVIRGSQSLNLLQKIAVSNFGDVKTWSAMEQEKKSKLKLFGSKTITTKNTIFDKQLVDFDVLSQLRYDSRVFSQTELNNCILINSSKTPTLRLVFPLEGDLPHQELFERAWCNVLGNEGEGSLYEVLNANGWAVSVSAFSQHLSQSDDILVLEIKLTISSVKKVKDVISTVLTNYKQTVFGEVQELARYLFELESIDKLTYIHQDICKSPMEEASICAQNLQKNIAKLGTKNILKGSSNWDSPYNIGTPLGDEYWQRAAQDFKSFVDRYFNIANLRFILLVDQKAIECLSSSLTIVDSGTDQFFSFEYTKAKFDPALFKDASGFAYSFVGSNKFIPKVALDHNKLHQFLSESSTKASEASLSYATKSSWSATNAQLVTASPQFELWTKLEPSEVFKSKVYLSFDLVSCSLNKSPLNTMNCEVLVDLLKLKVSKMLYSSELLNYTWEIMASLKGDVRFGFTISGFTDGVEQLLSILVNGFKGLVHDLCLTSDDFRRARVAVRSRYSDLVQDSSLVLAMTGLLVVMEENIWTIEDRIDALDDIDISSFKEFLRVFQSGSKSLKMIVHGDLRHVERFSLIVNHISNHLDDTDISTHVEPSTIFIKPGDSYSISRNGPKNDPTSSISYFIQTGERSNPRTKIMTRLFSYLMSLSVVPDLRFKKQLGYVVLGGMRMLRTTLGLHITVMSANFTPNYLQKKIDEYLLLWEETLHKLDEKRFQTEIVNAFLETIDKNLHESGGPESLTSEMVPSVGSSNSTEMGDSMKLHRKVRDAIFNDDYNSSADEIGIKSLLVLTKTQFLQFFSERISVSSQQRSSICVKIQCSLTPEETRQQLMTLQLEAFLKMNGLRISSEKLKETVERSGGSPVYLLKDLFKIFVSQGESLRLCSVVLKEVIKQVSESLKHRGEQSTSSDNDFGKTVDVTDIEEFQKRNTIMRVSSGL